MMFGAVICTPLSDKFGRKPVFLISQWVMVIVGVANAFAPNYYAFAVLRFVTGIIVEVCIAVEYSSIASIDQLIITCDRSVEQK